MPLINRNGKAKMNLIKENWKNNDIKEFNKYLESIKREDKISFAKKTINTNMELLGIPTPDLRKIAKEIIKGNYISYLNQSNNKYYENTIINALLINNINDIETKKYYISKLVIDNWATVDILTFKIKGKEEEYIQLAKEYIRSEYTFIRRIGVRILFNYTHLSDLTEIFEIIESLYSEEEYYVNMAVAWLMCEIVIKNRNQAFEYLKKHKLNAFTINKTISKCRDSYRVSKEDKEKLVQYRIK